MLILGAVISLVPFLYMIGGSFKSYGSVVNGFFWPWPPFGTEAPQWQNFGAAVQQVGWDRQWGTWLFVRYAANSTIVAFCTVTAVLVTSSLAAYAFAQMDVPGKNFLFTLVLATIMVPSDLSLVPKVVMMFQLHWYNTYVALIAPFTVSVFGIFLLRQFFLQIPRDLFDAARIDGAGHLRYLVSVVVPISYPAVVTIALFTFIWSWDEFKWPLLVTRDSNMRVLGVGLQQFLVGDGGTNAQLMLALATLVVIPVPGPVFPGSTALCRGDYLVEYQRLGSIPARSGRNQTEETECFSRRRFPAASRWPPWAAFSRLEFSRRVAGLRARPPSRRRPRRSPPRPRPRPRPRQPLRPRLATAAPAATATSAAQPTAAAQPTTAPAGSTSGGAVITKPDQVDALDHQG